MLSCLCNKLREAVASIEISWRQRIFAALRLRHSKQTATHRLFRFDVADSPALWRGSLFPQRIPTEDAGLDDQAFLVGHLQFIPDSSASPLVFFIEGKGPSVGPDWLPHT